jgi:hypothetical protein
MSKFCQYPGCPNRDEIADFACPICNLKGVRYCSKDCQENHWPHHKLVCGKVNRPVPSAEKGDALDQLRDLANTTIEVQKKKIAALEVALQQRTNSLSIDTTFTAHINYVNHIIVDGILDVCNKAQVRKIHDYLIDKRCPLKLERFDSRELWEKVPCPGDCMREYSKAVSFNWQVIPEPVRTLVQTCSPRFGVASYHFVFCFFSTKPYGVCGTPYSDDLPSASIMKLSEKTLSVPDDVVPIAGKIYVQTESLVLDWEKADCFMVTRVGYMDPVTDNYRGFELPTPYKPMLNEKIERFNFSQ